ncbi:uncharacterized protein LTR77_000892 [Saxophila tyrrhenica]|uniref:Transcription elongation factor Eaf N-terminal domain-containing protein n=1 Tax=Saxophila tyrrhenica TaxID=1690608 RepID=A0AAV9PTT8_9PEZI|nr:hypothetical protein LTR77_000892 [Saxophila tyrrhenica]
MTAATARSTPAIDFNSQATFPIRLGQSVVKPSEAKKFTSIQYNHKPPLKAAKDARYKLEPSSDICEARLDLRDGKDGYKYGGRSTASQELYALTPTESDAGVLAATYPPLATEAEEGLFGEDDDDAGPVDASNPWDYRNYLKQTSTGSRRLDGAAKAPVSSSSMSQQRAASSMPVSRPSKQSSGPLLAQKKRKAPGLQKADAKRVKAGTEPPRPSAPDVPRVRIDRKASTRRPSVDDSGELILENETPVTEKPPRRTGAMALALGGQLSQGPISLRSAANSPASMAPSPMSARPEGIDDGEEFEFGDNESSPEAVTKVDSKQQQKDDYFGSGDEDDEGSTADADADVENLELPSPAQTHQKSTNSATADDEDDLDKQLALAMAEDDEGGGPPPQAESDEESEEE